MLHKHIAGRKWIASTYVSKQSQVISSPPWHFTNSTCWTSPLSQASHALLQLRSFVYGFSLTERTPLWCPSSNMSPPLGSPPALLTQLTASSDKSTVYLLLLSLKSRLFKGTNWLLYLLISTLQLRGPCTLKRLILWMIIRESVNNSIGWVPNTPTQLVVRPNCIRIPHSVYSSQHAAKPFLTSLPNSLSKCPSSPGDTQPYTRLESEHFLGSPDLKEALSSLYPLLLARAVPMPPRVLRAPAHKILWLLLLSALGLPPRERTGSHLAHFFDNSTDQTHA